MNNVLLREYDPSRDRKSARDINREIALYRALRDIENRPRRDYRLIGWTCVAVAVLTTILFILI